ncbi:MAG: hypothetical protein ACK47B_20075 [Armatimonadota bacterium]
MNDTKRRGMQYLALLAGAALALGGASQAAPPESLEELCRTLSERYRLPIVPDPELAGTPVPVSPPAALSLPEAMKRLCEVLPGTAWRRLRVPEHPNGATGSPSLAATARRLAASETHPLVLEGGTPRTLTLWLEVPRRDAGVERGREVVVLYSRSPAEDGGPPEAQLRSLQRQQLAWQGGRDRLGSAYAETAKHFMGLEPAERERFGRAMHAAGMRRWDATPPAERGAMMAGVSTLLERSGLVPGGAPPGGAAPADPASRMRGGTLQEAAGRISRQTGARVVVEPALLSLQLSETGPNHLPIEEALERLTAALPGVDWCRIFLRKVPRLALGRREHAGRLGATVRALQEVEVEQVRVAEGEAGPARRFERLPAAPGAAERAARDAGLEAEPVYLVYSTWPAASGDTAEERLAGLQRAQLELLRRMSPDELERSLDQLFEGFDALPPEQRARVMDLPLTAAMMATWLPRQAQERGGGGQP